jgi:hypothetical protein
MNRDGDKQHLDGLTVQRRDLPTGTWYVWSGPDGRQVHAGMHAEQFHSGRRWTLTDGRWEKSREAPLDR